jgi:formylglycine-generating enzyme required for sulfatase activity
VKWTANGYRLPTEAEWEKAARGGAAWHRFPWTDSDTIQHSRANYRSSADYAYDTSPTRGYHPTFATGSVPDTSPAGYFAPNGYGLHDMAGNVWEWCWDWYDSSWYSNAATTQNDTRGPSGASRLRVLRGGAWLYYASYARCAYRLSLTPSNAGFDIGFRCVRGL